MEKREGCVLSHDDKCRFEFCVECFIDVSPFLPSMSVLSQKAFKNTSVSSLNLIVAFFLEKGD